MGQNKQSVSAVKSGMNRNTAPYLLEGVEYLFALNTNVQDEEVSAINVTNEESNILAAKFKEGYVVIGKKNDIITKGTYFFLVNPETEESEFGIIKNNQIENTDILDDLEQPLEEIEQEPYQTYESLIEKGLNLHKNYPVKSIVIKNENAGKTIAFTDGYNPPRLIVLNKLNEYLISDKEVDTEKINIFQKTNKPKINVKPVVTGGRLKKGTYQFLIAYTNRLGQEIGEYTSITNPIPIFDQNNVVMEDNEIANRTNYAIKLDITNLDPTKEYYKIVVIQNTDIEGGVGYFIEGVHPISDTTVIYSTEENKERITLEEIFMTFPNILTVDGIDQTNGHLLQYGIKEEKEINLQPVVNLMGPFLKWQTSIARETLYQSPDDVALSKGYMRNETYPLSIRFNFNTGYQTALFPFINRPAEEFLFLEDNQVYHETSNAPDTKDTQSIKEVSPTFVDDNRVQFWQYYNTATSDGNLKLNNVDYTVVQEPVTRTSLIEDVGIIPKPENFIILKLGYEPFTTLENFLEDNFQRYQDQNHPLNFIFEAFNPENYKDEHNIPLFEDCNSPTLLGERDEIIIGEIENEEVTFIKRNIDEYRRVALDVPTSLYVSYADGDNMKGVRQEPSATETNRVLHELTTEYRFEKTDTTTNNDRRYAIPLTNINIDINATKNTTSQGFSNDVEVRTSKEEILTNYRSKRYSQEDINVKVNAIQSGSIVDAVKNEVLNIETFFDSKVSINALWFTSEFKENEEIKVLEIPKIIPETKIHQIYSTKESTLRVTIFNDCTDVYDEGCSELDPIMYYLVDTREGDIRELIKEDLKGLSGGRSNQNTPNPGRGETNARERVREGGNRSNQGNTTRTRRTNTGGGRSDREEVAGTVDLYGDKFIIAIDVPIGTLGVLRRSGRTNEMVHVATGLEGKFAVHERPLEYGSAKVMFDEIHLDKREAYRADCNFRIPQVDEFEVLPFERGKFGYIESSETYPDNEELYNSSKLRIDLKKIPETYKEEFKDYYIRTNPDGTYQLNEESDFRNKPIRHFKFPDNDIAPFMSERHLASFSDSMIFPLGVYIDDQVVETFLDIAVDNDLLTQEQRGNITSYEIFRGDRTVEKSIVAKGLLYDNYKYQEEDDEVYFPNFPFNALGDNELFYTNEDRHSFIPHPFGSDENNSFMFISPDNQFRKLSPATEMMLEGFQMGNSKGNFTEVEDHPKWTILGDKGYRLANTLAVTETTAEVAIQIAEAAINSSETFRFFGGPAGVGTNPIGMGMSSVATGVIAGFQILSSSVFKVARYRHQWLETFKNIGQPENFASYYVATGHYNSLINIPNSGNKLRAINTTKELGSGRFSFRHHDTGERVTFNNRDREKATYIYTGKDFTLEYPYEYLSQDNNENKNTSSRPIASERQACHSGEVISNVASPYVSLRNYVPSQYGTLNSIKWLPTGHISYFNNSNKTIFGGDIYLSRMTMKRKMPLFLRDAMKVADLTPYNYGTYSNIGDTRFYVNYEVTDEVNLENSMFPDFKSEFNLDCGNSNRGFYLQPPSKFYLYYYGIVNFLVESEINTNFRYAKTSPRDSFYPQEGDVENWTQETNVSIKENNTFHYNFTYSLPSVSTNYRTLPDFYNKEEFDARYENTNSVMWSLPDNSETDLSEPWTVFRPYDRHSFPSSFGKLVDLKGIESGRVLGRFTNQSAIFNAVDLQVDGINSNYGDGHLFSRPPRTFAETDLGYLGSQSSQIVSNEFGHFFTDTERGAVFRIHPAGEGIDEISKYTGNNSTGMDKWFKKHLPFKVLNPLINNYDKIDLDNPYSGVGITMGWDSKYKRVFLTKKDYIPLQEMNYENKNFFAAKDEFELITDYESDGYTYLGKEDYYYKFSKSIIDIPQTAPLYILVNTNDYTIEEAREIKEEVSGWVKELEGYEGEVIFIATNSNRWLRNTNELLEGRFNSLYRDGNWNTFSTYTEQPINTEGIIIQFINTSAYQSTTEPTNEFITDYRQFTDKFGEVDYLKNLIITKDPSTHITNILNNRPPYRDVAIPGTNPQRFLEALRTYGYSHMDNFNMDTERFLNELLGDEFREEIILIKGDIIEVTDTEFFKDVSWTLAYQVDTGRWISYYSFKPNYYIDHNTYFQTGIENTLWSHNISKKSYGVFYGEKQPWIIEYPIKNEYVPKRLQNLTFWTEAKKYVNDYDFAFNKDITFNKAVIYNTYGNSGQLNLIPQKTLRQQSKYPINRGTSQDILINYQDFNWTLNNIYDRTLNQDGTKNAWIYDENEINKDINSDLVQFGGKKILSYLRGEYFIVRLTHDDSTEHNILFKWASNDEEVY